MKEQNYKNHQQIVYRYYLFTGVPILILLGIGIVKMFEENKDDQILGVIILLISWIFLTLLFRSRGFALKAQDRAIRAEEGLRYFILTGKKLDSRITLTSDHCIAFCK